MTKNLNLIRILVRYSLLVQYTHIQLIVNTICSGKMFTIYYGDWRGSLYKETDLRISKESVSDKMFTI